MSCAGPFAGAPSRDEGAVRGQRKRSVRYWKRYGSRTEERRGSVAGGRGVLTWEVMRVLKLALARSLARRCALNR